MFCKIIINQFKHHITGTSIAVVEMIPVLYPYCGTIFKFRNWTSPIHTAQIMYNLTIIDQTLCKLRLSHVNATVGILLFALTSLTVTVRSTSSDNFRGFLAQARPVGSDTIVGRLVEGQDTQLLDCSGGSQVGLDRGEMMEGMGSETGWVHSSAEAELPSRVQDWLWGYFVRTGHGQTGKSIIQP